MDAANSKKNQEAVAHIKNAEKCLKTNLMKWKVDYDTAADEYSAAALCYKTIKQPKEASEFYRKSAECHKQNKSYFNAGKAMEQAILLAKESDNLNDIGKWAEEACDLLCEGGSYDTGSLLLEKAGNILAEKEMYLDAVRLYQKAANLNEINDNFKQAAVFASKASRLLVKLEIFNKAVASVRYEIGCHRNFEESGRGCVGRLTVVLVLLQLARRDPIAADKAFKETGEYCEADEASTLELLIEGYLEEDAKMVQAALESPFIKHMDVEYAKLAKNLPMPSRGTEESVLAQPSSVAYDAPDEDLSKLSLDEKNSDKMAEGEENLDLR